jgi:hypothetical protein
MHPPQHSCIAIPVSGDESRSILHTVVKSREEINSAQTRETARVCVVRSRWRQTESHDACIFGLKDECDRHSEETTLRAL